MCVSVSVYACVCVKLLLSHVFLGVAPEVVVTCEVGAAVHRLSCGERPSFNERNEETETQ